jgi:hypothetical protein
LARESEGRFSPTPRRDQTRRVPIDHKSPSQSFCALRVSVGKIQTNPKVGILHEVPGSKPPQRQRDEGNLAAYATAQSSTGDRSIDGS